MGGVMGGSGANWRREVRENRDEKEWGREMRENARTETKYVRYAQSIRKKVGAYSACEEEIRDVTAPLIDGSDKERPAHICQNFALVSSSYPPATAHPLLLLRPGP